MPIPHTPIHHFHQREPEITQPGFKTWLSRGHNFVVAYTEFEAGATMQRGEQQKDEYMVFLLEGKLTVESETTKQQAEIKENLLAIVPPKNSSLTALSSGRLIALYSSHCHDLAQRANNAGEYAQESLYTVAPLGHLTTPEKGYQLRIYDINQYRSAHPRMRIFRSQNLMLNLMLPRTKPRDLSTLSPHHHDDFEQGSLTLAGQWIHHLRHPWGADYHQWRADEHLEAGSPALLVIPPTVIHTSMNTSPGTSWLIDIFAPPRADFCAREGMICNAGDYPYDKPIE